ncbi:MAG: endolytic transglycosylase MltG [Lachnospiraceae bacterium]|nr:endolytic transglycosylase MltG [Lachnospiraceae bacterium]
MSSRGSSKVARLLLNMSVVILTIGIAIIFYVAVAYGIRRAANYSYDFAYQIFGDVAVEAAPGRDVKVTIMKGESTMNIASKLQDAKVIVNKYSFFVKLKLMELGKKDNDPETSKYDVMPGTYILNTSMSYNEVLDIISDYSKSIEQETTVEDVESTP